MDLQEREESRTLAGHDLVIVVGTEDHVRVSPRLEVSRNVDGSTTALVP